jgi:DNA-binding transcriptional MerR regulator
VRKRLSIGDFALITRLSVTTLRHYHRVGLLEPADVDPSSNYRYYTLDQVPTALTIRRYRQLQIPVEDVAVLLTADDATRDGLLQEHLERMRTVLQETQDAVSGLQALLIQPRTDAAVARRSFEPTPALAESSVVERDGLVAWWKPAIDRLRAQAARLGGGNPVLGGLFDHSLFTQGRGEATVFVPIAEPRPGAVVIPGGTFAVAVHHGLHSTIDLTYAVVGAHLAATDELRTGPVREHYLVTDADTPDNTNWQTEICWPVPYGEERANTGLSLQ